MSAAQRQGEVKQLEERGVGSHHLYHLLLLVAYSQFGIVIQHGARVLNLREIAAQQPLHAPVRVFIDFALAFSANAVDTVGLRVPLVASELHLGIQPDNDDKGQ